MELFDLKCDPGCNVNGSGKPENADTVRQLTENLKRGGRAAGPQPATRPVETISNAGTTPDEYDEHHRGDTRWKVITRR